LIKKETTKPKLVSEQLILNGKMIVNRTMNKFVFNNNEMPKSISTPINIQAIINAFAGNKKY
jgi:hypothetical protein